MKKLPLLLIFDVNETLLDLSPLKEDINTRLNSEWAFELWFNQLIQYSMVETLTDSYSDFGEVGLATLKMVARRFSVSLSKEELKSILSNITQLQPYFEVKESIQRLTNHGYKCVALSNGGLKALKRQMDFSGLSSVFSTIYSVESVKKFKPHSATYTHVLHQEQCTPQQAMLVAAHAWDIAGAQAQGLQTAFIQRPGKYPYPNASEAEITCPDLKALASKLIQYN